MTGRIRDGVRGDRCEAGAALLIILMIALAVASIALAAATQAWSTTWRRDCEEELIFRGNQYVDGLLAYRKEHQGQFPVTLDDLFKPGPRRLRYIRKLWRDPVTHNGKWGLLYLMPGAQGVYDPVAAQKAQQQGGGAVAAGGVTPFGAVQAGTRQTIPGVTPINQDPTGTGVRGLGPSIAGAPPPGPMPTLPGGMPGVPKDDDKDDKSVSEPPLGLPIVGVISRASGKVAEHTFRIYKGHEHVDEWQFHVFERGVQMQPPPQAAAQGGSPPPLVGPGFGGQGSFIGSGTGWRPGAGMGSFTGPGTQNPGSRPLMGPGGQGPRPPPPRPPGDDD